MEEIIDGVIHWKALHPHINSEVGCHFVTGSKTAIDLLLPDEGIEWFNGHGVEWVVLSTHGDPLLGSGREALRGVVRG
jgi:hypothetical protein